MFIWKLGIQSQFVSSAWLNFSVNILQCLPFSILFVHFNIIDRNNLSVSINTSRGKFCREIFVHT